LDRPTSALPDGLFEESRRLGEFHERGIPEAALRDGDLQGLGMGGRCRD